MLQNQNIYFLSSNQLLFIKPMTKLKWIEHFQEQSKRELHIGIYTDSLFSTKSEDENHIEIGKLTDENQILVGIIIYGDNRKVNKALNGLKFHG
jgi:hypothetical protein